MSDNKPAVSEENNTPEYTPGQLAILTFLKWVAWGAAIVAMLYVMHG